LRPIETLFESNAVIHRDFTLRKTADPCTGSKWLINDRLWHDITEFPVLGTTEVWNFINRSGVSHPMHLHLVLMQVLDRQAFIVSNNVVVPTGPRVPPPAGEAGWKDTVRCDPGEITRVITRFDGFTGRYPYHCHILEHEDHEMMRQFEVIPPPEFTSINRAGNDVVLGFNTITNLTHAVSRRDDYLTSMWTTLFSNLTGTGSGMFVTNTGAATQPQRYYRLELTPTNQPP
jgi:Multicopper oxidase